MLGTLDQIDKELFGLLNSLHHPAMDEFMWLISTKWFWIPFYLLLLIVIYRKSGWKGTLPVIAAVGLLILLADQTASGLLKPLIQRFRPCQPDAHLSFPVHIVHGHCGGYYGFVSSHAANFFALATFFYLFFQKRGPGLLFFFLAGLTAYSRIYLGVHYPGDIIAGALLGIFWALIVWKLYVGILKRINLNSP